MLYKLFIFYLINEYIISYINSNCSLGTIATNPTECIRHSTNDEYCCFISPLEDTSLPSICYPYNKEKYHGNLNINHNKQLYEINCGLGSTYMDIEWDMTLEDRYSCGKDEPDNYEDCSFASTKDNSCCFYEGKDLKRCYWLGIKYTGKSLNSDYNFVCCLCYININLILYFMIVIFIFL